MDNKELIKRLLEFPMDVEINIDMHHNYPLHKTTSVGWDDDKSKVWITNY